MLTVSRDQPEIAELLLEKGAQVDAVNKGGCSSLHVAVNKQHLNCVKVLVKHRAHVNIQVLIVVRTANQMYAILQFYMNNL